MATLIETRDLVTNFYTYEGVVQALDGVSLARGPRGDLRAGGGIGLRQERHGPVHDAHRPGARTDRRRPASCSIRTRPAPAGPWICCAQSEAYMERLRGDQISMIFQEPNAALNPIMSIGDQVAESFLFHRRPEMCRRILEDLATGRGDAGLWPRPLLRALYRLAAERPGCAVLRLLSRIPLLRRWQRPLKKEALRRSVEIVAELGISNPETVVRQYPHNLSGGMKQRIVIAIALACRPMLLIADEATCNLDVTIQAQILDLLKSLKRKEISSVLLITHDLGVVAETCDRVGVMYAGQSVRDWPRSATCSPPPGTPIPGPCSTPFPNFPPKGNSRASRAASPTW